MAERADDATTGRRWSPAGRSGSGRRWCASWRGAAPPSPSTATPAARRRRRWPGSCARRGGAAVVAADLLDRAATAALVPAAAAALGRPLTVLVNNASIFEYDTIATATWESWDRHIGSNLRAPFELIQAFAAQAPKAAADADGQPVARAAVVNMLDQRVLQAHAGVCDLYDCQDGALGADPHRGAGAGAGRAGERDRARADAARGAPVGGGTSPASGRRRCSAAAPSPREIAAALGFILDSPSAHRAAHLHRRRPASRLGHGRRPGAWSSPAAGVTSDHDGA